ncbi:hypothetical protein [Lactococcus allomyrinae]|uniref:hypothetical protein n=1 Tax=Lactococcus allomyrinae TaxID=2419773 RepID=UPI0013C45CDD|nr:hypothetical protein [Lactococcus allomyrinae]
MRKVSLFSIVAKHALRVPSCEQSPIVAHPQVSILSKQLKHQGEMVLYVDRACWL